LRAQEETDVEKQRRSGHRFSLFMGSRNRLTCNNQG
jgi:hypothetical protein